MSILIKGIDMPSEKEGWQMDLRIHGFDDGTMMVEKLTRSGRPPFKIYRAIQIPTPHGRLIDKDELLSHLKKDPLFDLVERYGVSGVIESRPTILEAEE